MLEYFVDTKVVSKVYNGCLQLGQEFGVLLGFLSTPACSTIDRNLHHIQSLPIDPAHSPC